MGQIWLKHLFSKFKNIFSKDERQQKWSISTSKNKAQNESNSGLFSCIKWIKNKLHTGKLQWHPVESPLNTDSHYCLYIYTSLIWVLIHMALDNMIQCFESDAFKSKPLVFRNFDSEHFKSILLEKWTWYRTTSIYQ